MVLLYVRLLLAIIINYGYLAFQKEYTETINFAKNCYASLADTDFVAQGDSL